MKYEYTVTGKTVEEAYNKARDLYSGLGDIEIKEVVSQGKKGFLGIFGAQNAEIKIVVDDGKPERKPQKEQKQFQQNKPQQQKPQFDKQKEVRPNNQNQQADQQRNQKQDQKFQKPQYPQKQNQNKVEQPKQNVKVEETPEAQEVKESAPKAVEEKKVQPAEVKESAPKAVEEKKVQPAEVKETATEKPVEEIVEIEETVIEEPADLQEEDFDDSSDDEELNQGAVKDEEIKVRPEEKEMAVKFIESFIKDIGFDCKVVADMTPDEEGFVSRNVSIEGENASVLIGHHGETLDSIQYLANLCIARHCATDHKEYVKIILDIEGYRVKREETLRALARRMAEKALRHKRNIHLDPMNPYERRIIHSEIQKIDGVSTHSVGYDETRKIIITVDRKNGKNY